jgi:DNA-binding LacI/PurR family transcriptional regulator
VQSFQRATLKDVALRAGVHAATVSRVLNQSGPVSEDKRQRVMKAVKELNFHLNSLAGALKTGRRNAWGFYSNWTIIESPDYYYSNILSGVSSVANNLHYRLSIYTHDAVLVDSPDILNFCYESQIEGLILLAPLATEEDLAIIRSMPHPTVLLLRRTDHPDLSFVAIDSTDGVRQSVRYLAGLGHRKIAFFAGESDLVGDAHDRKIGYETGMAEAGLAIDPDWVIRGVFAPHDQMSSLKFLQLKKTAMPTAVICTTDDQAFELMQVLQENGFRIPHDISVIGFNDRHGAALSSPSLTTVHQPFKKLANLAAEHLKECQGRKPEKPFQHLEPAVLVVRNSTAPPPIA